MGYLTIFEGPDGGGKTTAAKAYAEKTGAIYVHFYEMAKVSAKGLPRMYVEAMLPALIGDSDVVFDRSWLSEEPYRKAFRPGLPSRCDAAMSRMLERLAMQCQVVLVMCRPPLEVCRKTFLERLSEEMLETTEQLDAVYDNYTSAMLSSSLIPVTYLYNYTDESEFYEHNVNGIRYNAYGPVPGPRFVSGNPRAQVCIVDVRQPHTNHETWFRFPGISTDRTHPYHWLTEYLAGEYIDEQQLCWVFADGFDVDKFERQYGDKHFIALGAEPAALLAKAGHHATVVPHPRNQRNVDNARSTYTLAAAIRKALREDA